MKKTISLLLVLCMFFMIGTPAFAADGSTEEISPQTDGYTYWQVDSKNRVATVYDDYKMGPILNGNSVGGYVEKSITDSVSNRISGSYTSKSAIEAAMGIEIEVSFSVTSTGGANVPVGNIVSLDYRPYYSRYKIVQNEYIRIDGRTTKTGATKTCYVDVFEDFNFNPVVL